jgi:hypothetical protein
MGAPTITQAQRDAFIAKLSETSNITESCRHAGVGRSTIYLLRANDEAFAKQWAEAVWALPDRVLDAVIDEAINGAPVFNEAGQKIGTRRNTRLLERLAARVGVLDPEKPTTAVQVNTNVNAPAAKLPPGTTEDDYIAAMRQLLADVKARDPQRVIDVDAVPVLVHTEPSDPDGDLL